MTKLDANTYGAITFDCYGTLIDWENGVLGYLQPLLESYDVHVEDDWVLAFFAEWEPCLQAGGDNYRAVLAKLVECYGTRLAFTPSAEAMHDFARSIEYWQPFPDAIPALRAMGQKFALGVVSDVDNDLFGFSAQQLGIDFAAVITAQDVGAYKPDPALFEAAIAQLDAPVLHVGQSKFHDITPAKTLGLDTVLIDRGNSSLVATNQTEPTWTFDSLQAFSQALLGGELVPS